MRDLNVFLHTLVCFFYQAVCDFFIGEITFSKLLTIAIQFGLELWKGVQAHRVGFPHFEFKLGIEVQVFAKAGL